MDKRNNSNKNLDWNMLNSLKVYWQQTKQTTGLPSVDGESNSCKSKNSSLINNYKRPSNHLQEAKSSTLIREMNKSLSSSSIWATTRISMNSSNEWKFCSFFILMEWALSRRKSTLGCTFWCSRRNNKDTCLSVRWVSMCLRFRLWKKDTGSVKYL